MKNTGKNTTIYGNFSNRPENFGDNCVIVNPTDANGNTILHHSSIAIGYGAKAGNGSIAIGANAVAGMPHVQPQQISLSSQKASSLTLVATIVTIISRLTGILSWFKNLLSSVQSH